MTANISKTPFGTYRARKVVKGKRLSKNFSKLKEAKAWVSSI